VVPTKVATKIRAVVMKRRGNWLWSERGLALTRNWPYKAQPIGRLSGSLALTHAQESIPAHAEQANTLPTLRQFQLQ
jgi:hypothetical protein